MVASSRNALVTTEMDVIDMDALPDKHRAALWHCLFNRYTLFAVAMRSLGRGGYFA